MEIYELLLPLALILFLSKLLGLGAQKIGMPAVIGMLIAGILISLLQYIPGVTEGNFLYDMFFSDSVKEGYQFLAEIGVVLIMFSAGMGTDLKQIKATGVSAIVITTLGVVVPMLLGFLVAFLFDNFTAIDLIGGGEGGTVGEVDLLSDAFYGAILTATSVSITVATLKELGKLNSPFGTAIVSAAVIDDIIGIVILSVMTGLNGSAGSGSAGAVGSWFEPGPVMVCIKIVVFFIAAVGPDCSCASSIGWEKNIRTTEECPFSPWHSGLPMPTRPKNSSAWRRSRGHISRGCCSAVCRKRTTRNRRSTISAI